MSNSAVVISPEIQAYIETMEEAVTYLLDGQQAHDVVAAHGCTEKKADELCDLSSSINRRGTGKAFPYAVESTALCADGLLGDWEKEAVLRGLRGQPVAGNFAERDALGTLIDKVTTDF
jgi:hypothetical protein